MENHSDLSGKWSCHKPSYFLLSQILVGFERLQAIARSRLLMRQFQTMRQKIVQLQARCRGYLVRQQVRAKRRAVVIIQAHARGMVARKTYWHQKSAVGSHLVWKGSRVGWDRGENC